MQIAILENNQIKQVGDYKELFPNVSFPSNGPSEEWMTDNGAATVTLFKDHNRDTENLVSCEPYLENGMVYLVSVESKTQDELDQILANKLNQLKTSIVQQVQTNLDNFAKEKNYDSILSACSYANSTNSVFKAEGELAVSLRDATWLAMYAILEEVATGVRVVESFSDIEGDLPVLAW